MERLIRQTIHNRLDALHPISVSILIQFKTPAFRSSYCLNESAQIPSGMGELGSTRNVGICTTVTTAWKGVVASHVQVKPVITKAVMMVTHAIKNDHHKSDSGLPIRSQKQTMITPHHKG
jgi:hypothetical protein